MSLPTPPLRSDGPALFADRGDAFLGALPQFETDMNALNANVNAKEASAVGSAAAALSSANTAATSASGANFKGNWSALTGALAMPASVAHLGAFWALNTPLANVTTAVPGVSAVWTKIKTGAEVYPYTSRATLRTLSPAAGDAVIVVGLGLFNWFAGSVLLDDDETAFSTASGQWLLAAADPDYVYAATLADMDDLSGSVSTLDATVSTLSGKFLRGSFTMSLTSLATVASSSFTVTVTGAAVGDSVIVNPGDQFGTSTADQGRLSYVAYVSAANTVTVTIRNASAATAALSASTWQVLVIKQ